jgi:ferrochelatase
MRHWHPYIKDTVKQMAVLGVERAVVVCLAPHYSEMSTGAYRKHLDAALAEVYGETGRSIEADFVPSWHLQPEYLSGIATRVRETMARFPDSQRVKVIFTAHSLPAALMEQGDPYEAQLRATAECLASSLDLPGSRWMFAYQSAARQNIRWLGPAIQDVVREQAQAGETDLLIAPVGFICDHAEVLYDLDIEVQRIAAQVGAHVERTPMLNDGPELVKALASIVSARLAANQERVTSNE